MAESTRAYFSALARHTPLGLLVDLDGTLLPFAGTPEEARPGPDLIALLVAVAATPGVELAVVSGRPRASMASFFGAHPGILLVAEHGAWRCERGAWTATLDVDPSPLVTLSGELERLAGRYPGALVERKTWSVALHFRRVLPAEKDVLLVQAAAQIAPWIKAHAGYERLDGAEVIEVRCSAARKEGAVTWMRQRLGGEARLLALGDDLTDEDMFAALLPADAAVIVGNELARETAAGWRLGGPQDTHDLLRWIVGQRQADAPAAPPDPAAPSPLPVRVSRPADDPATSDFHLLVVSNRLPELRSAQSQAKEARKRNVGGLVSALEPVLAARRGVWLGWSGRTVSQADGTRFGLDDEGQPALAWLDFPEDWHNRYYNGLCNSALWPLFHSFPGRVHFSAGDWEAYRQVNDVFAGAVTRLLAPERTVWVHDYHLLLLGSALRRHGHRGPVGLFLHIPFPGMDIFSLFPWAAELLDAMLDLDLIGLHTPGYVDNFRQCAVALLGAEVDKSGALLSRGRRTVVKDFPIGIIPETFQEPPAPHVVEEVADLMRSIAPGRLVLGVDRLDYTKGIRERLLAFGCLLQQYPEWRRKVSLVQISVPSRADIPEYIEQRAQVENTVGRINGEFGEAHWVPIRYLYRSYSLAQLAQLYRAAAVGYVTPLRDGMNLVAKEYVAAQDAADPGVLLLSRFAGAAVELHDALLTNPWHAEGMAADLDRALRMGLPERQQRHTGLLAAVSRTTALTWAEDFLRVLAQDFRPR